MELWLSLASGAHRYASLLGGTVEAFGYLVTQRLELLSDRPCPLRPPRFRRWYGFHCDCLRNHAFYAIQERLYQL